MAKTSAPALEILRDALQNFQGLSPGRYNRWTTRMALTFTRENARTDDGPIAFDAWSLVTLQPRACQSDHAPCRFRMALAVFRPVLDLHREEDGVCRGTGRVSFQCVEVRDLASRENTADYLDPVIRPHRAKLGVLLGQSLEDADRPDLASGPQLPDLFWCFEPTQPPVFESSYTTEEWLAAEVAIEDYRAWPAAMFARNPYRRWVTSPVDGSVDPWAARLATAAETYHGSWVLRDGCAVPSCQVPAKIVTYLSPFLGRWCRNPAAVALRRHRLLPTDISYKHWLRGIVPGEASRRGQRVEPRWVFDTAGQRLPDNAAAYFQSQLESQLLHGPVSCATVLETIAEIATFLGLPFDAADTHHDDLATLLERPWEPVLVPREPMVQLVGLTEPASLQSLSYHDSVYTLNLFDLGSFQGYDPLPDYKPAIQRGGRKHREKRERVRLKP